MRGHIKTVLVVDDGPEIRRILQQMLRGSDFSVLEASGSWDVFDICEGHADIDLLIIDDLLPCDSCARITDRLIRAHPNLRVILCPALPLDVWPDSERATLERLPKERLHWLAKPFSMQQLLRTVEELCILHSRTTL